MERMFGICRIRFLWEVSAVGHSPKFLCDNQNMMARPNAMLSSMFTYLCVLFD